MTRLTRPSWAKWFTPRVAPSPWPAAKTKVRSRGSPVSRKRRSRARASSSGKPTPTKPVVAIVSPASTSPAAASAVMTLFRLTAAPIDACGGSRHDQGAADDLAAVQGLVDPPGVVQRHPGADRGVDGDGSRLDQPDQRGHVGAGPAAVGPDQPDRPAYHVGDPHRGGGGAVGDAHRDHGPALAHHRE